MKKANRNKRVLFDLNHPADFHFFKHLIEHLLGEGYEILVVARDKECLHVLLRDAGIPFSNRGKGKHSLLGKYLYAFYILVRLLILLLKFNPGMTMSLSSPYLALLSRFLRITCISFDDTDDNPKLLPLISLSKYLFSPASYPHHFHSGHFRLPVFKELAYLHPNYFQIEARTSPVFFRITRTDSIHHSRASSLDLELLKEKISDISLTNKIILSSELSGLEMGNNIQAANLTEIHHDLSSCRTFWGNSATMAAEAAVLGIPTVFVGAEKFAYISELEEYGLLFHFLPEQLDQSIEKLKHLMAGHPSSEHFMKLRRHLLSEKMDMTSFLIWFVENLPDSAGFLEKQADHVRKFVTVNPS